MHQNESQFLKKYCKDFNVSLKVLDLFNKNQTYGDVITGEENAFEDLELYVESNINLLIAMWLFYDQVCLFLVETSWQPWK